MINPNVFISADVQGEENAPPTIPPKEIIRSRRLGPEERPLEACLGWADLGVGGAREGGVRGGASFDRRKFVLRDSEQGQILVRMGGAIWSQFTVYIVSHSVYSLDELIL